MISHKNITTFVGVLTALAVILCFLAMGFSQKAVETLGDGVVAMQYPTELFDTDEPIRIDILMAEGEWEDMLENAMEEEYYACDVVVNEEKIYNVGIRPKGNTSLSSIAMDPDTERFSLKLEFDHYEEGQTCFGLDKLILNNNYADATNMKEALIYDMYQYLGADASLYNYAEISVNGGYWGVYLALEAIEDSFLLRSFGTKDGELYKPDPMEMGGGEGGKGFGERPDQGKGGRDFAEGESSQGGSGENKEGFAGGRFAQDKVEEDFAEEKSSQDGSGENGENKEGFVEGEFPQDESEEAFAGEVFAQGGSGEDKEDFTENDPSQERTFPGKGDRKPPDMENGPGEGHTREGENGANLNYTDDELDSYSDIWDGEVTETGDQDHRRVVTALKNISEGTDLETYLDVDNILKYMAVHVFSVNMDSLSGNMAHNYYLYEQDGMLNIFPWDYNLSFGGMNAGPESSASEVVNDAIDTPFQGTAFFDALLENEAYLSKYHTYLKKLAEEYVLSGRFETVYQRIRSQIDSLVETDPTALCSYEEYEAGAQMLYQTVLLRAESILGQVDGAIPSTDEGQKADPAKLVDASAIDIDTMGIMNNGGRGPGQGEHGNYFRTVP